MPDSPFQGGHHSDDVSVYSDTSHDALRDNSEPAALVYSEISDEDDDGGDVTPIVISEDDLTVTQPESVRRVTKYFALTLTAPIATKVVCFSRLLKCFRSIYGKQCGPRSNCSHRSSLFWVHAVSFYLKSSVMLGNYLQQTTSADDIFRCIFS